MNYNAYWYDPEQDQVPWDTNDICIGNRKYICKITEVTSGNTPEEALASGPVARGSTSARLMLLVADDVETAMSLQNINPYPDLDF